MRTHGLGRWNWSKKAQKWVFVEKKNGKRTYKYQEEEPQEFKELANKIQSLNQQLLEVQDHEQNLRIYQQLMSLSKKMQAMKN